jgi:3-methylcrotonyl-CoA carboxylase beta subunit
MDSMRAQYEREGSPYFSAARLWDDGIIDPVDTRNILGLCLDLAMTMPIRSSHFPVFRM